MLTAKEAAEHVGKSKATILRHIKEGKLSAGRDASKSYRIDPSELVRVYGELKGEVPYESPRGTSMKQAEAPQKTSENEVMQTKLEAAIRTIEDRDRELQHRNDTIDDLRSRLDTEGEERRKLTAMLTDQRTAPDKRKSLWSRLTGK